MVHVLVVLRFEVVKVLSELLEAIFETLKQVSGHASSAATAESGGTTDALDTLVQHGNLLLESSDLLLVILDPVAALTDVASQLIG